MANETKERKRRALQIYEEGIIKACEVRRQIIGQAQEAFRETRTHLKEKYRKTVEQEETLK